MEASSFGFRNRERIGDMKDLLILDLAFELLSVCVIVLVPLADLVVVVAVVVAVAGVMLCARKMAMNALENKSSSRGLEKITGMSDMECQVAPPLVLIRL